MLFFLLFPFKGITIGGLANREECFLKIIARKLEYTVELDGGGGGLECMDCYPCCVISTGLLENGWWGF